jgi:hypothetical protein
MGMRARFGSSLNRVGRVCVKAVGSVLQLPMLEDR